MIGSKYRIILHCWLIYGFFYLNRLNLSPVIPLIMSDLDISHARIGFIGASFYIFYTLIQLPAGYLSDLFGPQRIIVTGGMISAFSNIVFSFGSGLWHLTASQSLNGLGQGGGFSPIIKIIDRHFPFSQRGRVLGWVMTSTAVFNVIAFFLAGYIGQVYGWRQVFWGSAIIFVPVLILFNRLIESPGVESAAAGEFAPRPRHFKLLAGGINREVFSGKMCFLSMGFFCLCYITYSNLIWLPSFLFESFHLSLAQAGLIAALYPLTGFISRPLGGYISDIIFKGKRKQTVLAGLILIFLSTLLLSRLDNFSITIYLIVAVGFFDNLIGPLFFAWMLDLVPHNHSGTGAGMLQFFGHMGTVLSISFSGLLLDVFQSYRPFFLILSAISIIGIISTWLIDKSGRTKN